MSRAGLPHDASICLVYYVYTCMWIHIRIYVCACAQTNTHTQIHAHPHTHTHSMQYSKSLTRKNFDKFIVGFIREALRGW